MRAHDSEKVSSLARVLEGARLTVGTFEALCVTRRSVLDALIFEEGEVFIRIEHIPLDGEEVKAPKNRKTRW